MTQLGKTPTISMIALLLVLTLTPAFAEVTSFELDKIFYTKGDQISFSGTVDGESKGLVTIVIRDSNGEFLLLTQAFIQPDNTFQRSLDTDKKFEDHGIHNATAFILDLAKGKTTSFDFSQDGTLPVPSITAMKAKLETQNEPITEENNSTPHTNSEPNLKNDESILASFVDPSKDPQHYFDRYYNEPSYKEWFDRNFPNQSIYDVVGISDSQEIQLPLPTAAAQEPVITTQESVPVSIEASTVSYSSEFTQMLLALGGLVVLFGAVYGIKRKVDNNSEQIIENKKVIQVQVNRNIEQISQNCFWLKNKLMNLKKSTDPIKIIQERLAKGEISVDEYYQLVSALNKQ